MKTIPESVLNVLGVVLRSGAVCPTDFEMVIGGMAELDYRAAKWLAANSNEFCEALIALMRTNANNRSNPSEEANAVNHAHI